MIQQPFAVRILSREFTPLVFPGQAVLGNRSAADPLHEATEGYGTETHRVFKLAAPLLTFTGEPEFGGDGERAGGVNRGVEVDGNVAVGPAPCREQ